MSAGVKGAFSTADRYNGSANLGYQRGPLSSFTTVGVNTDRRTPARAQRRGRPRTFCSSVAPEGEECLPRGRHSARPDRLRVHIGARAPQHPAITLAVPPDGSKIVRSARTRGLTGRYLEMRRREDDSNGMQISPSKQWARTIVSTESASRGAEQRAV